MARLEKSVVISAPTEDVFAYIEDPMTQLEWLPGMREVKDVTPTEEGVGTHFRWVYKMAGISFDGETTVTENVPNQRRVIQSKGGIDSTWIWTFETHNGGTKLSLDLEYTVPIPVLGKLAEKLVLKQNEKAADDAIRNIKAKLEG
jgi:carbon monoxide dehydrogenase subunit G